MKRRSALSIVVISLAIVLIFRIGFAQNNAPASNLDRQLLNAVSNDDLIVTRKALDDGANIEARDANEATPLMTAAEHNNVALVNMLLEKGANPANKNKFNETALTFAARGGHPEIVAVLLTTLVAATDATEKKLALFEALRGGNIVILEMADDAGKPSADPVEKTLDESQYSSWMKTVKLLLDKGVPIEARDEDGSTPLMVAAAYGETDMFKLLLSRGADIHAKSKFGSALMGAACQCAVATMNGTYNIIKILLEKGADPNERGRDGVTPLIAASGMQGDPAVLKVLLDAGADPTLKDKHGKTALAWAVESRRDDKVEVLSKVGNR